MKWLEKFKKKSSQSQGEQTKPAGLRVSDFLTPKTIHFFHSGPSKQQVLGTLISSLQLPDPNVALKAILAREEVGSTIIASGLALPHARIPGITRIQAALGLSATGVLAPRASEPIKAFVLFLGPADNMREHLAFLATLSALFQKEGLIQSLVRLHSADEVLSKIRKAEEQLG
jgi:nitrogen PTS system EIIA component